MSRISRFSGKVLRCTSSQNLLFCCLIAGPLSSCSLLDRTPASGPPPSRSQPQPAASSPASVEAGPATTVETTSAEKVVHADLPERSILQDDPVQLVSHLTTQEPVTVPESASLSLREALEVAARNNPHMRVIAFVPLETGTNQDVELAAFDPSISAGGQYMQANQQVSSALQASGTGLSQYSQTSIGPSSNSPNLMQVEQRYSSGTTARVGVNSGFNQNTPGGQFLVVNPAYQSSLNATIEQSLMRNFGTKANMRGLHIAKANQQQSFAEFQTELNNTLYEVQKNYWMAWLAGRETRTYEELVEQAELTWRIEQKRLEVGEGTLVEPAQAFEHLQTMRVELESARKRARQTDNQLKAVLGIPATSTTALDLTEEPIREEVIPDLSQGVHQAIDARPEIEACNYAIQQAQMQVDNAENLAKPDVSAYAGYALTGLDDGLMGSLNNVASTEFGNASLGLRFKHVWGGRAAKANVERAELALSRQRRALREAQQQIEQSVRNTYDAVQSSWNVLQSQEDRLSAAEVQFQTYSKLYEAGQLDLDRLIRARTLLANALHERQTALVEYNLSLVTWNHVTGATTSVPQRPLPPLPLPTNAPHARLLPEEATPPVELQKVPPVQLESMPR